MRDLKLAMAEVPEEEALRASIPRRERFTPAMAVLSKPLLRTNAEGKFEVWLPAQDRWKAVHAMHAAAAEALAEGLSIPEAIERARPACPPGVIASIERIVRSFFWLLHEGGVVRIDLEPTPAVLGGRFEVVEELGRGAMGVVLLCRDREEGGALVAAKHAWGWSVPIERAERSIRREASVLSRLDHPLIPALVDAFEVEGLLHVVRGFAPGAPLQTYSEAIRAGSSAERLRLLRGCADALAHVHERGFVYLDVKGGNFMLDSLQGDPKLVDFGTARPVPPGGTVPGGVGSPGYAAPEMVRRPHVANPKVDVYSLGRTFAMIATGRKFKFPDTTAVVDAALEEAGVGGLERDVLVGMCQDDPERRTPSMRHVVAALG